MVKLCECGCGEPAPIASRTNRAFGHVKGEPMRFLLGHPKRKRADAPQPCACGCGEMTVIYRGVARRYVRGHNGTLRRLTATDYHEEDRGYSTPCWIWNHALGKDGRGRVTINGRPIRPYVAMYEQEVGPVPDGHVLHHRCEVPACVRPGHVKPMPQGQHVREHGLPGWNRTN